MPGSVNVVGGNGQYKVKVSPYGELVTSPYDYSTPYFKTLEVDNTGYTFVSPKQGQFFVITSVLLQANRNVSAATPALVDIYESADSDNTTISKSIYQIDMLRSEVISLTGLTIRLSEGVYLNGKTSDDDILATISGYYVTI